ncbi:MAG: alpha/beta fold hydrolase [Pseudomonadota bacterium]
MTSSAHATFDDIQIETAGPQGPMRGTLLLPDGDDVPVVLIIPGSGPTDRDGNNPLGVKASTYRLLAEGLAQSGIASVRVVKRGMFASATAVADANAVTLDDYANDVHAWVATIRERTGRGCVWLLGHSEGGTVAMVAAAEDDAVCGVLLVATPGRPHGDVIREQLRANPANAPILDEAFEALTRLEAGDRVDTTAVHPALLPLFADEIQGFMIDLLRHDPAALAADLRVPVLVLQGTRDIQVTTADAERLGAANKGADVVVLPDTNHVLKTVTTDDRNANLATYADPDLPLAPGVVPAVAAFIRGHGDQR